MVTRGQVKFVTGLLLLAVAMIAIYLAVRHARGDSKEEAIRSAEHMVRRGGFPCSGPLRDAKPPTPEFFEGNRIYHRYVGPEHPDIVRGLGKMERTDAVFFQARSERIRSLSGAIWTAQSACRGAFLIACSDATSTSGAERDARCEPWRRYALWSRDDVHFDLPEISARQCGGCGYLFD